MGLMDKVKAQAGVLAQKTQETVSAGQAKIDSAQANRKADGILRQLGLAYLAERTGRATPETSGQIDKLLADLVQHESQNNVNLVQQAATASAQQAQMQAAPGDYLTSSQVGTDPNVSAAPVGFPQEAGPVGFPQEAAPVGFPQEAAPVGFPGAAPATSFPQPGDATAFPEAPPATFFPPPGEATAFPDAAPPASFPEAAPAAEQPDQSTGFPPASGP